MTAREARRLSTQINLSRQQQRSPRRAKISGPDPCRALWRLNKALEFALLQSFAVPWISGLLDRTGDLIREFMSNGLDSDRTRRAFARMNEMQRFRIANDDFFMCFFVRETKVALV